MVEVCLGSAGEISLNAHFFYVTPLIDFGDEVLWESTKIGKIGDPNSGTL